RGVETLRFSREELLAAADLLWSRRASAGSQVGRSCRPIRCHTPRWHRLCLSKSRGEGSSHHQIEGLAMRFTFRLKVVLLLVTALFSLGLMMVSGELIAEKFRSDLNHVQASLVPRAELALRLEASFVDL